MRTDTLTRITVLSLLTVISLTVKVLGQSAVRPAHVGIVYPLSTNGTQAAEYTNRFSLHVIAGVSKGEMGAAISGISNIVKGSATGATLAGFSNHIGLLSHGASISGFMNMVRQTSHGVMVTGFLNQAGEMQHGYQVAGFANIARKSDGTSGQISGFMNHTDSASVAVTGFLNSHRSAKVQVGGFLNLAKDANIQVAGFMNVAKKVKGVQVAGLLNIADSSDYSIALINIVKHGEKQISLSIDETSNAILSFKSGGRVLYGIVGVGYNFRNDSATRYAFQGGIGAHLYVSSHFRINMEATNTTNTDFHKVVFNKSTFGVYPAYRFGNNIEVFAGPTFNEVHTKDGVGEDLAPYYIWSKHRRNDKFNGVYVGGVAGVQVRL
ncbi:hypothetical protein HHL17_31840 [Chitinophaga sp. G-6-1-13]|uniref:Uncharacterized protein n=1 Tax=Chitinophaga fulva TaxID=2728842 RepID=A0A848GWX9_9BACT|nr:hypothetical protein [Chitinophaga fulva]NML41819.1 hypothetical protein [Chitinophaga fulva]